MACLVSRFPSCMKILLSLLGLLLLAVAVSFLSPGVGKRDGVDPNVNLPWQVAADGQGGSTVFGLHPGSSTLADVKGRLGDDLEVAIVAAPGEVGTLEGYYAQLRLGFVQARMIVTVDVPPAVVAEMRERAPKAAYMESTTMKISLHPEDLLRVERLPVRAISVIPAVNLNEETVVERFGQPGERLRVSDKRVHLLYPEKGLDVTVDQEGKELLQYVAPRDFGWLRDPLRGAAPAIVSPH